MDRLTDIELEIVNGILDDLTSEEIGQVMGISTSAVSQHRRMIRAKTGAMSVQQLREWYENADS